MRCPKKGGAIIPKIVDHDEYREELLNRYFELFARRGYLDVTMREIAKELGVSTGTLYHYFPTKRAILEQLFRLASRRDTSEVLSTLQPETSIEDRLQAFIDIVRNKETYWQDIVLLTIDFYRYQDAENFEEYFQIIREADAFYMNSFTEGLQLGEEMGYIANVFLNGLIYNRLVFPNNVSFDRLADRFKEMFLFYVEHKLGKSPNECPVIPNTDQ
ncbi:MAG: TetR/AcrR family transcriptional regulator [Solirubrobacterales bacterium]